MSATDTLSVEDRDFLAQCEEEFQDRFTEKDDNFMTVHNAETSVPPIVCPWWVSQNSNRRYDRRNNQRFNPYIQHGNRYHRYGNRDEKFGNRDRYDRRDQDRSDYQDRRGYNDHGDRNQGYHQRPRY